MALDESQRAGVTLPILVCEPTTLKGRFLQEVVRVHGEHHMRVVLVPQEAVVSAPWPLETVAQHRVAFELENLVFPTAKGRGSEGRFGDGRTGLGRNLLHFGFSVLKTMGNRSSKINNLAIWQSHGVRCCGLEDDFHV